MDRNSQKSTKRFRQCVALREEGVDRNDAVVVLPMLRVESPSARRAWIEICGSKSKRPSSPVALREEGVDRNQK